MATIIILPDPVFAHPRLARVYDVFDRDRDDLTAYLSIADQLGADRVLDIGCGTGCLAVLLAKSGRTVVGVDPAQASLEVAKSEEGTATIIQISSWAAVSPNHPHGRWHRSGDPHASSSE